VHKIILIGGATPHLKNNQSYPSSLTPKFFKAKYGKIWPKIGILWICLTNPQDFKKKFMKMLITTPKFSIEPPPKIFGRDHVC
jgi:hypothetical protein